MRRLFNGAIAGAVAWGAMDYALRSLYNHEDPEVRRRETRARGGVPALEVLADRLAGTSGIALDQREREWAGTGLQWIMGIGTGMLYGRLRKHIPRSGLRRGLVYGAAFSIIVDETLTPAFGLAPGPLAFPWQTHGRGFVAHLIYGVAAEAIMQWLERRS